MFLFFFFCSDYFCEAAKEERDGGDALHRDAVGGDRSSLPISGILGLHCHLQQSSHEQPRLPFRY